MEFLDERIDNFVCSNTSEESKVLQELNRETWAKVLQPRMLSGHLQGRVLSMLCKMIAPKSILEIGTYTSYSALCLAEGLQKGGKLVTIDRNEELEDMVNSFIQKSGLEDSIDFMVGNAMEIIPSLNCKFDLVFIDADKENYSNYYNLLIDKLDSGAYIIADNVLWSGKVIEEYDKLDAETKALVDYSNMVQQDDRVENVLFPIRDGLMICRKK